MKIKLLLALTAIFTSGLSHAVDITNVRYSNNAERTRIVFDLNTNATFSAEIQNNILTLHNPELGSVSELSLFDVRTPLVLNSAQADAQTIALELTGNHQYKAFSLKAFENNQARFVVDIFPSEASPEPMVETSVEVASEPQEDVSSNDTLPNMLTEEDAISLFDEAVQEIRRAVIAGELTLEEASDLISEKRTEIFDQIVDNHRQVLLRSVKQSRQEVVIAAQAQAPNANPTLINTSSSLTPAANSNSLARQTPPREPRPKLPNSNHRIERTENTALYTNVSDDTKFDANTQLYNKRLTTINQAWRKGRITDKQALLLIERQKRLLKPQLQR